MGIHEISVGVLFQLERTGLGFWVRAGVDDKDSLWRHFHRTCNNGACCSAILMVLGVFVAKSILHVVVQVLPRFGYIPFPWSVDC